MSDRFSIRRYDSGDAEAVWDLHERALRASPIEFVEDTPADEDLRAIGDRDDDGAFLVGHVDGEIVAMGGFQRVDATTAELRRMRVDPAVQGRGYGTRILETIEERISERGLSRIVLETTVELQRARRLYERHGYTETGRAEIADGIEMVRYEKSP